MMRKISLLSLFLLVIATDSGDLSPPPACSPTKWPTLNKSIFTAVGASVPILHAGVEEAAANLGAAEEVNQPSEAAPHQNHGAAMANSEKMVADASASIRKEVFAGVEKVVATAGKLIKDQQAADAGTRVLSVEEAMGLLKKTGHTPHDVKA